MAYDGAWEAYLDFIIYKKKTYKIFRVEAASINII